MTLHLHRISQQVAWTDSCRRWIGYLRGAGSWKAKHIKKQPWGITASQTSGRKSRDSMKHQSLHARQTPQHVIRMKPNSAQAAENLIRSLEMVHNPQQNQAQTKQTVKSTSSVAATKNRLKITAPQKTVKGVISESCSRHIHALALENRWNIGSSIQVVLYKWAHSQWRRLLRLMNDLAQTFSHKCWVLLSCPSDASHICTGAKERQPCKLVKLW